jgi:hypothetical protein
MRYFTKADVVGAGVCRVVVFGKVYELGKVLEARKGDPGAKNLLEAQGTDISHWFKNASGKIRTARIENAQFNQEPFSPVGDFLDLTAPAGNRWWEDERNVVGRMASRTRLVTVENILTGQAALLEVPVEETLQDIQNRYMAFNFHAASYTWKFLGRVLDMNKTLDENAIPELEVSEIASDVPVLHVYFNDDLTEA